MDLLSCGLINSPMTVFNIAPNIFFIFCLICSLNGEVIKQPLKLLLGSLICCTVTYLGSGTVLFFQALTAEHSHLQAVSQVVVFSSLFSSMSSSVWLNFFYYTKIVPAQRALCIWIKKNVKSIVYCFWLAERIFAVLIVTDHIFTNSVFNGFSNNFTTKNDTVYSDFNELETSVYIFFLLNAYFIFCLCVMMMSSGLTAVYLCRHMRRMVANGQCLSCPQLRSQVRVTVTGILQGFLYLFCAVWSMSIFYSQYQNIFNCSSFTVFNFYIAGTTFNLGVGQAVFRQRAAAMWQRAARCCKAPKVQPSEAKGPDTGEVNLRHL